jgi:hypothetical protein
MGNSRTLQPKQSARVTPATSRTHQHPARVADQHAVLRLQRQIGNRSTVRVLRAPPDAVGGLSVKERMAMLASSGQPGGPAGAPKGGPVGASLKQRMASLAQNGMKEDPAAAKAKAEVEQERLTAEAFRSFFFY